MRHILKREHFIPKHSMRVADKNSDAECYIYQIDNVKGVRFGACFFVGKAAKPLWHYIYTTAEKREASIAESFKLRQASIASKAKYRAEENAKGSGLVVGDILKSSWGYDQTNVDWYEVTALIGAKMVELRKIAAATTSSDGNWTGQCVPQSGDYIGEPMRKLARNGGVTISSCQYASKWNTNTVAGVPIGPSAYFSTYA
jgi:hypothetical protein